MSEWDIFLSHASEDKASIAEPLAQGLREVGLRVWLDSAELRLGDSLRERIDHALANSRFAVVVLSPAFLQKDWTRRELDGIMSLDRRQQRLLPVWHELDANTLARESPLLAAKIAVSTSHGIAFVVREILRAIGEPADGAPAPSCFDSPETLVGTTVGRYGLTRLLGRGGSGAVFIAENAQQRQPRALKLFFPLRPGFTHLTKLFERGFRATQAINHPNVLRVLDYGTCTLDGRLAAYLVSPFTDGMNLGDWMTTSQADVATRVEVAYRLADALDACHNAAYVDELGFQVRGVCHGDVKPSNILIDRGNTPYLIDFLQIDVQRFADLQLRALHDQPDAITAAFGTIGFMHSDQARYGIVAPHTDVYSFAVTLAHLFARRDDRDDPIIRLLADPGDTPSPLRDLIIDVVGNGTRTPLGDVKAVLGSLRGATQPFHGNRLSRWFRK